MASGGESVRPRPVWRSARVGLALIGLILSVIAITTSAFILITAHEPVLKWDEWLNWSFLVDRGLWDSIYCRHNGHPMFVPNIFYRINAFLFAGDSGIRSGVTWAGAAVSGVGLAAHGLRGRLDAGGTDWPSIAIAALVCAMMTCAAMGREITWGMAIHDHLPALGVILVAFGLVGVLRNKDRFDTASVAAIVLGAALATFSFAFGLAVWGALPLVLALASRRVVAPSLVLVVGALISLWVMKFTPSCTGVVSLPLPHAFGAIGFALGVIGAGVASLFFEAPDMATAVTFGVVASAAALWATWIVWTERARAPSLPGLLLVIWYALGAALLAGLGRSLLLGMENGLHGRFFPISFLAYSALGLFVYVRLAQSASRVSNLVGSALIGCIAIVILQCNVAAVVPRQKQHASDITAMYQLMLSNSASENALVGRFGRGRQAPAALKLLPYLRERQWDLFRDPIYRRLGTRVTEPAIPADACRGEFRSAAHRGQETVGVFGWARFPNGEPATRIILTRDASVVGFGRSAAHFKAGFGEQQWTSAPGLGALLGTIFPDLAIALGLGAEWAGAVRVGVSDAPLHAYALRADGSLCRLGAS